MSFTPPVRRVDRTYRGRPSHHYEDADGRRVPGVTTILSDGWPKPALVGWGIKSVAEYALDHWDELGDMAASARLATLKGSPYAERDAAARRGTEVHNLAEQLVHGQEVDVPPELAGHVESYVRFLDDYAVEPILVERTVVNYTVGYAGTLDLVANLAGIGVALCDVKTNRSGVYGETGMQLAAYRYAEVYLDDDGTEVPMPEVDDPCYVIHVRADDYDLVPVRADDYVFNRFRHVGVVARASAESKEWVGAPLTRPESEAS